MKYILGPPTDDVERREEFGTVGGNSRRALRRVAEHGDIPMRVEKQMARYLHSAAIETLEDLRQRLAMERFARDVICPA